MNVAEKIKNRKSFILLLIAFGLPILLAKLALEFSWLEYGVTNQGELLDTPFTTAEIGLADIELSDIERSEHGNKQWLLMYLVQPNCGDYCEQLLVGINNTYIALGKEMPRVTPIALFQTAFSPDQLQNIRTHDWRFIEASPKAKQQLKLGELYIADPLGNIFLVHALPKNSADIPAFGKAILADMKKLLKYSKVG